MKKEKKEIAINTSSGAEKVETIEKEIKQSKDQTSSKTTVDKSVKTAKGDAALGDSKAEKIRAEKMNAKSSNGSAEKESAAAKARVEAALKRKKEEEKRKEEKAKRLAEKKEKKEKRLAEKKALIEKRAAEKKALIEKRQAERKALAEKRAAEKEKKIRDRAHAKASKNQEHSKKKNDRHKNRQKREDKEKGYGGWLAAVIALGAVTLGLTTAVTVGAIDMRNTKNGMMTGYRATMSELTGIIENVDNDLDRVRVSASSAQQSRILTDLLVQTRLAELDLEKLPMSAEMDANVTTFINRTAMECERMLAKLRKGEPLSSQDQEILEKLYVTNHSIRAELGNLAEKMTENDMKSLINKMEGGVKEIFDKIEDLTMEENRLFGDKKEEKQGNGSQSTPKSEENSARIDATKAEELCSQYFSEYKIEEFQCIGEMTTRKGSAYNVQGYDEKGSMLFAEIDQQNGALVRFDYFEDCTGENFDLENAQMLAEQFLKTMGYADMEVVRESENGTMTDFTFVYSMDGVAYYPDEIHVKVCRTRGVVSGMDASRYLQNHKERVEPNAKMTLGEAYGKLHEDLNVESSRMAVIKVGRSEKTAYEFLCSYKNEMYVIYLDANTGEEISIVNVKAIG